MQVVIHAGAHMTDEDRLVNCLRLNSDTLAALGTYVPNPQSYRRLLRDLLQSGAPTALQGEERASVMAATGTAADCTRLILSNHGFFGTPKMALGSGRLYPAAEPRVTRFHQIFAQDALELFVGLRNPATFLPALLPATNFADMSSFLRGDDPLHLRWSDTIAQLRAAFPDMPITVWCNEDTPLIWSQILREMAGTDPTLPLEGEFALLPEIMTAPGYKRFEAYLEGRPGLTEAQKRRVVAAFLDKFADEDAVEEELDLPGWDGALIETLSALYDEDMAEIEQIDGVTLITP